MERISDELLQIMQELKERRAAEATVKESLTVEPLDIKAQLRLVRDRCPDVFMFLRQTSCVKEVLQVGSQCETTCDACEKCWGEAF